MPGGGVDLGWRTGRRRVRRLITAVCAAAAVVLTSSVPAVPARAGTAFVLVQMNLCNSGMATTSCYSSGRAVDEAVGAIDRYRPDLVTLQEVCRDDLYAGGGAGRLTGAMAALHGGANVTVDFVPVVNRDTGGWYRCVNGELYGVAMIHHHDGHDVRHGWYASQDATEEVRAWACGTVITGRLTGCTTHLSTDPAVALRQCHELMAQLTSTWAMPQVIVAGDLNLSARRGEPHDVRRCVPAGYHRRDDGALQQVIFSATVGWVRGGHQIMRWTDHPVLYETFRI